MRRFASWLEAKERAGLEPDATSTGRNQVYSDEDVLAHLRECARRSDGRCTVELLQNEADLVAPSVAIDRFNSWLEAKREAGLDTDERTANHRPREYSDQDYLELLRECEEKHGKATKKLFDLEADGREEHPTSGAVRKRFGSWNEAKSQAGLTTSTGQYTNRELIEMLRECREKHGKVTVSVFASDGDFCSPETLQRRFGSWSDAKARLKTEGSDE
jgi:transposase